MPETWLLEIRCKEALDEAPGRDAVTAVRAFPLAVLILVLVAAVRGAVQSRAAEANKTVVLIFISDRMKDTSPEME
jgi:hypothetical protein